MLDFLNTEELQFFFSLIPQSVYKKFFTKFIKNRLLEYTNLNTKEECPITLSKYRVGYKTPCNHSFSKKGLNRWIKNNYTCPICRSNLLE